MLIFRIIWIAWCASEVLLNRLLHSGSNDRRGQDKGSLIFIWMMISLAISLGFIFAIYFKVPISNEILISYVGLFIIVVGMAIRFVSIWTLGKYFTVDVTIRDDHKLKKDGFYKIIRHPSYSGSLLTFLGFGLTLGNYLSLLIVFLPVLAVFLYRINIEEKALIYNFKNEYTEYQKKTKKLIPFIY